MFRVLANIQILNQEAVKTITFNSPRYIGDPINILRILSAKGAQEIVVTDIGSTKTKTIDFNFLNFLAEESRAPFSYGGGISSSISPKNLTRLGVERFYVNTLLFEEPNYVANLVKYLGSSSVAVSIDLRLEENRWICFYSGASIKSPLKFNEVLDLIMKLNPGEIVFKFVQLDGLKPKEGLDMYLKLSNFLLSFPGILKKQLIIGCGIYNEEVIRVIRESTIFDGVLLGSRVCYAGNGDSRDILISYPIEYAVGV